MISLASFFCGWWNFSVKKHWLASLFLLMLTLNAIFYVSLQTWVPVRSSIYLLPFILIFQASGLKDLIGKIVNKMKSQTRVRDVYISLTVILICYFTFLNIGKYQNFDPESGNPYELSRTFLKKNTGPNDLIISSLHDTKTGFYFGELI